MQLTEKHIIKKTHRLYDECDRVSFLSKNLYNYANYMVRQTFINTSKEKEEGKREQAHYHNYNEVNRILIDEKQIDYVSLPRKVSNGTLMLLDQNWKSFFASIRDWGKNKHKYKGQPKLPNYLPKDGRYVVVYERGAISTPNLRNGIIKLSQTDIEFTSRHTENLNMVRIVPGFDQYTIEVVYTVNDVPLKGDNGRYASIDLGVNNLATITTNIRGIKPKIVNGRPLKSINQHYNSRLAYYKSKLEKVNKKKSSKRTRRLTNKRNNKVNDYLHKASTHIVNEVKKDNINTLVVGKNINWKQEVNIGKVNNQNFVSIPHSRFIDMLSYKCEREGIRFIEQEESYTSKASFLSLDIIPIHGDKNGDYEFSGYRKHRGLYCDKKLRKDINADVNGSYNILRKAIPEVFIDGIEGLSVNPVIITIAN